MDNILKVCDDTYCIEVYKNSSNITQCNYKIYPSNKHTFPINNIWVIITLLILLFIILSLCIICIYCYFHLHKKIKKIADDKLSDNQSTNSAIRHSDTIPKKSDYQPIPGNIGDDNFTYFRFHKQVEKEEQARDKLKQKLDEKQRLQNPIPTLQSRPSEEELLIDKAFNTLRDRTSNSIHQKIPKLTQIKHRGSLINITIEASSNSTTSLRTDPPTPEPADFITPIGDDNEYQLLPNSTLRNSTLRNSTIRNSSLRVYPAEYELNKLESTKDRSDFNIDELISAGPHGRGTQDDMIYKEIRDDFDYKEIRDDDNENEIDNITIDDFSRFSTIRLIKFFAPQEIKYCDIDFSAEEFIGQGSVGKVFKAKYNGIHVAVKKLNDKYFNLSSDDLQNFKREASLMQKVGGHKHIARMYGFCTSPEICIVTEYYSKKSIKDIIINKTFELNNLLKLQMCYEASLGILHLHQQNVIHRDISARNLLVDENWTVVVSDLGMSRLKKNKKKKNKNNFGPIKWMAPESITMHIYSEKTDVYSFGITLYEIFSESDPYPDLLPLEAGAKVVSKGLRPQIDVKEIPDLKELLETLWKHEPSQRPKCKSICQSLKSIKDKLE